ncbi:15366_t:CDS:2, partial [Acaulospora colombiana]
EGAGHSSPNAPQQQQRPYKEEENRGIRKSLSNCVTRQGRHGVEGTLKRSRAQQWGEEKRRNTPRVIRISHPSIPGSLALLHSASQVHDVGRSFGVTCALYFSANCPQGQLTTLWRLARLRPLRLKEM